MPSDIGVLRRPRLCTQPVGIRVLPMTPRTIANVVVARRSSSAPVATSQYHRPRRPHRGRAGPPGRGRPGGGRDPRDRRPGQHPPTGADATSTVLMLAATQRCMPCRVLPRRRSTRCVHRASDEYISVPLGAGITAIPRGEDRGAMTTRRAQTATVVAPTMAAHADPSPLEVVSVRYGKRNKAAPPQGDIRTCPTERFSSEG